MTTVEELKLYLPQDQIPGSLANREFVPIVSMADEVHGIALKSTAHTKNWRDRISVVFATSPDGQTLYLQRRDPNKHPFPNFLTATTSGHVTADPISHIVETYEQAAQREFIEETGLKNCPKLTTVDKLLIPPSLGHSGIYQIYTAIHAGKLTDFKPNSSEVAGFVEIPLTELAKYANQITPPMKECMQRMGILGQIK